MTRDPIGERGGINLYAFVNNNPMNLIDPFELAPGDCFPTMDEAAKDMRSYVRNLNRSWEWGGWIYELHGEGYTYTEPVTADPPSPTETSRGPRPKNATGDYHSHTRCRGYKYNEFSDDDKYSNYIGEKPGYLVTPDGNLLRYDPVPFSRSTPFNPNSGSVTPIR